MQYTDMTYLHKSKTRRLLIQPEMKNYKATNSSDNNYNHNKKQYVLKLIGQQ